MAARFVGVVLAVWLSACSAVHECTDGETQVCRERYTQTCVGGQWAPCSETQPPFDAGPLPAQDVGPRADASPVDLMDAAVADAARVETDTDPQEGDVVSPGACTWSAGPPQALTTGPSGGMQLDRLTLGATSIHVPWTAIADNVIRAQTIGLDGAPASAAQMLIPASTMGYEYGSIAESATRRAALVGPTRGSIIVPLAAGDVRSGTDLALYAGRCWDLQIDDTDAYTFLCAPADGGNGVTWHRVDIGGSPLETVLVAQGANAQRSTSADGSFLVVAEGETGLTTQRFDARGVAMSDPATLDLAPDATLRDAPPIAIEGGWLLALGTSGASGTYATLSTLALDPLGRSSRPVFVLPDVHAHVES